MRLRTFREFHSTVIYVFFLRGKCFLHYVCVCGTPGELVYPINTAAAYLDSWDQLQECIGGSGVPPAIPSGNPAEAHPGVIGVTPGAARCHASYYSSQ